MAGAFIESEVGAEGTGYNNGGWAMVRAMLIAYGSGNKSSVEGFSTPIQFGPKGRSVWDDSLKRHKKSESERDVNAPDGWNQEGNEFPDKAYDEIKDAACKIMEKALENAPPTIFDGVFYQ